MSNPPVFAPVQALGLMSGTSLDGVDVALIETDGEQHIKFIAADHMPYPKPLRATLSAIAQGDVPLNDVLRAEKALTETHVKLVKAFMKKQKCKADDVAVCGFHGQTIRHLPNQGLTWQLGDAQLLRYAIDIPVVNDFRRLDMAAGGEGAPLVPLYHKAVLGEVSQPAVVLNLGGVGNITYVDGKGMFIATDTGPGMGLIDAHAQEHLGKPCDKDGKLAAQGIVDNVRVQTWMKKIPFFQRKLPRSADRYEFSAADVSDMTAADGAATLCAFTVAAVLNTIKHLPIAPQFVYVTGGGSQHPVIMEQLRTHFPLIKNVSELGLRADSLEAECFAWLAVRRLRKLPLSYPTTTKVTAAISGGMLTV